MNSLKYFVNNQDIKLIIFSYNNEIHKALYCDDFKRATLSIERQFIENWKINGNFTNILSYE